jgi:predicted DNA-binding protein (MmcQ/YjbR family)
MPRNRADVPPRLLAKLRAICMRLPEAQEETAWAGTRWTIRKRNFAHAVHVDAGWPPAYARAVDSDGPISLLTFRCAGDLHETLRSAGPPFHHADWGTLWGTKVIAMTLDRRTSWDELTLLVTESYRLLAPKKLAATLSPATRP